MPGKRQIRNLALVGFMGAGKSSVGRLVAERLHFHFLDTDDLIESVAGKSITKIFAEDGEPAFREHERRAVEKLSTVVKSVISTGGGLPTNEKNLAALKSHSLVVYLWASPRKIWERVRTQEHRPLLEDPDPQAKIQRLLAERDPFYRQADVLVNTELRSIAEVAQHIVHEFRAAISPNR